MEGKSRQIGLPHRFVALDGVRGLAALMVIIYHLNGAFYLGIWSPRFAYLAVDLFFGLSGFVIAYSYDKRFAKGLTFGDFILKRCMRLYPLFLLGLLLSLVTSIFQNTGRLSGYGWLPVLLNTAMLPAPGSSFLFPVNPPCWSLFLELWVANFVFGLFWKWLHGLRLIVLIVLAAFGLLAAERVFSTLDLGSEWQTVLGGLPRVFFSFFTGVRVARFHAAHRPTSAFPSWLIFFATVCTLSLPLGWGRAAHAFEVACPLFIFPALLYWGADAREHWPWLSDMLGELSYAAYALHWPLMGIGTMIVQALDLRLGLASQFAFAGMIGGIAYALHHWYDVPIRARLARLY